MTTQRWTRPADMPACMRKKAHIAGMWDDDTSHIWFVPDGGDVAEEIERLSRKHGGAHEFVSEGDGTFYVDYHS